MRLAFCTGLALAALGCVAESQLEARTAADMEPPEASPARAPDIDDRFDAVFASSEDRAPRPGHARSVSLGFIGDGPLGVEPNPPHEDPYWTRPFPCDWTATCRVPPPCACGVIVEGVTSR
jgi:hypothetical protein